MSQPVHSSPLTPVFSSAAMRVVFEDRARLQRMLDVVAALARAQSALGIVSTDVAIAIGEACRADRFDLAAIAQSAAERGDIASALLGALTSVVAEAQPNAAPFVGYGASSQDVLDTTLALEMRAGLDALNADLERAIAVFLTLAGRYRRTPMLPRDAAAPTPLPLGLTFAGCAAALARSRDRLRRLGKDGLALQLGGVSGTLASLDIHGVEAGERLSVLLDLPLPDAPWQSHRDRIAEIAAAIAILAATCGKIVREMSRLTQTRPMGDRHAATATIAAATQASQHAAAIVAAQANEFDGPGTIWRTEWTTLPTLLLLVSGAAATVADLAEGLDIDTERLRAEIDDNCGQSLVQGVCAGLAKKIGKPEAEAIVDDGWRKAKAERRHLHKVLAEDSRVTERLSTEMLARLFEPLAYQGVAQVFIDRLVASSLGRSYRRTAAQRELRNQSEGESHADDRR